MLKLNVFDIKRFAVHDGPGIRTTVFMKGCPLRCWWCHNPESQSADAVEVEVERRLGERSVQGEQRYGEQMRTEEVMEVLRRDRAYYEESGGGVTFSGGEPLMQPGALAEMLSACRREGLHTVVDTCGHGPQKTLEGILADTDLFFFDLKGLEDAAHRAQTGVGNTRILENLDFLLSHGAEVTLRIPVVPGVNITAEETTRMMDFIGVRAARLQEIHLLPYHRIARSKYEKLGMPQRMPETESPGEAWMQELARKFESTGLPVRIGG